MAAEAESEPASEPEPAWQRNRKLRLAALEAANARGAQLLEKYGREQPVQRYAFVGHAGVKRRRRR